MKKLRHWLCIVLSISMLLCAVPVSYASDGDFRCSSIRFTDAGGNAVTTITAGTTLKASMTVKPNAEAAGSLVFAMMLYSGNKLIASDCVTKSVAGGTDFSAQVAVPSDAVDCRAVAVLWNSVDEMRAVCAAGVFPGGENLIRGMTMDGKALEGFDPDKREYNYAVDSDAVNKPVINAEAANSAATVKYIGDKTFPGKTAVEVTAADGSGKATYTINYTLSRELADSARILKPDGSVYGNFDVGKNLNVGDGGDTKDANRTAENGKLGSKFHWDRTQPANVTNGYTNEVRSVSDEYKFVLGSDYLMSTAESGARANDGYQTCVRLYRSATLYVFSTWATNADGWDLKQGKDFLTAQNDTLRNMNFVSSKHIEVDDPSVGVDVAIPLETMYGISSAGNKLTGVSITAIVYDGYETIGENEADGDVTPPSPTTAPPSPTTAPPSPTTAPPTPTTAPPTPTTAPPSPTTAPPTPTSGADSLKIAKTEDGGEVLLNTAPKNISTNLTPYTDENPTGGSIIMFDRGRNATYGDYNNIKDIADDYSFIVGCDYIGCAAQGYNPSHRASAGYETSFKLYEGATVYVFTTTFNKSKAEEYGWTYAASADDGGFMKLRTKATAGGDAVTPIKHLMTKHFDGGGETVVINREMLYAAGGNENSAGFSLIVIKYDK